MKRSEALAFAKIIKAWGEGKTLQWKDPEGEKFVDVQAPATTMAFINDVSCYRIKPKVITYYIPIFKRRIDASDDYSDWIYATGHPQAIREAAEVARIGSSWELQEVIEYKVEE